MGESFDKKGKSLEENFEQENESHEKGRQTNLMRHNFLRIVFWISILNLEILIFEFSFYCG